MLSIGSVIQLNKIATHIQQGDCVCVRVCCVVYGA